MLTSLLPLVAMFATPPAEAQAWRDQLQQQTEIKSGSGYADFAGKGYSLVDVAHTAVLDASASETVNISLPSGSDYYIMGVCDNDCSDLDLALLQNGNTVESDTTADDWPILEVPGGGSGYQLRVTMYQCSTPDCGYQITVWRRSGSSSSSSASSSGSSGGGAAWQEQLRQQTQIKSGSDYANMSGRGYSMVDVAATSLLDANSNETVDIQLPLGHEYIIMGVCDNDCTDLDLAVMKSGIELSRDTSSDDWPIVEVMPTGGTDYQIKVTMYQCSTPNCGYQLTVWRK